MREYEKAPQSGGAGEVAVVVGLAVAMMAVVAGLVLVDYGVDFASYAIVLPGIAAVGLLLRRLLAKLEYPKAPQSGDTGEVAAVVGLAVGMMAVVAGAGLALYGVVWAYYAISLPGAGLLIILALVLGGVGVPCLAFGVIFVHAACLGLRRRQWNLKHLVILGVYCAFGGLLVGLPAAYLIMYCLFGGCRNGIAWTGW